MTASNKENITLLFFLTIKNYVVLQQTTIRASNIFHYKLSLCTDIQSKKWYKKFVVTANLKLYTAARINSATREVKLV